MTMTTVAAAMQRLAAQNGVAKHKFQRGLALTLRQEGRQRTLAAGRVGVYPSDKEIEIITLAFGVPAGIDAMLCIAARHAVSADGARQQALDEIAASLNNVAAIIARHKLAGMVNGPIPPVPPRDQPGGDDDDPYNEDMADDEPAEDAPSPATAGAEPDMHPRQRQIYRYISTNPGCTPRMVADNCGMSLGNVGAQISLMRKDGIPITGTNTRPTKYRIGA